MADTVTSATLLDGVRLTVMSFTNQSDGTGESAVVKVDASELVPAASGTAKLSIMRIWYATQGMAVKLLWDATTPVLAYTIPPDAEGFVDFRDIGGLKDNSGSGATGDIKFTTVGHSSGDSYNIVIEVAKI